MRDWEAPTRLTGWQVERSGKDGGRQVTAVHDVQLRGAAGLAGLSTVGARAQDSAGAVAGEAGGRRARRGGVGVARRRPSAPGLRSYDVRILVLQANARNRRGRAFARGPTQQSRFRSLLSLARRSRSSIRFMLCKHAIKPPVHTSCHAAGRDVLDRSRPLLLAFREEHLVRVEEVERVERPLDGPHERKRRVAQLGLEVLALRESVQSSGG